MTFEKLTLKSVDVRPVLVPLKRPVVSKVGRFDDWPVILPQLLGPLLSVPRHPIAMARFGARALLFRMSGVDEAQATDLVDRFKRR